MNLQQTLPMHVENGKKNYPKMLLLNDWMIHIVLNMLRVQMVPALNSFVFDVPNVQFQINTCLR